ncbi:MAG: YbaB/EbfC family nucleoid-associated protein [Pseudomonadota bacterium]|nr:YbaB/EbfC family nucleoid-associated protein [Pseudomonadota bacterium]
MNIGQMMKQMQGMQAKMADMQARLGDVEVSGASGGGMVTVTMSGKGDAKKVKLDPKLVNPDDIEMLEDLVTAAFNDAKSKVERHVAEETEKMMGGLQLPPGVKLPF